MTARALVLALILMPGCAPVVIGTGAALIADEVIEQRTGDDGLF